MVTTRPAESAPALFLSHHLLVLLTTPVASPTLPCRHQKYFGPNALGGFPCTTSGHAPLRVEPSASFERQLSAA
jgi:hypothetical protein